jgi:hypothetical protein
MKLKEVIERNRLDQKLIDCGVKISGEEIHQDRAYLLELVSDMEDLINCSCRTCSAKNECNFWSKYEKLEGKDGGMRPCPKWNSNKSICNLDSKTCMVSQYDWHNCPKRTGRRI